MNTEKIQDTGSSEIDNSYFKENEMNTEKIQDTGSSENSTASTSGYGSTAVVKGEQSIALADGINSKARGSDTCWLFLDERDEEGVILGARAVAVGSEVDGIAIEPDTYYALRDGQVVLA